MTNPPRLFLRTNFHGDTTMRARQPYITLAGSTLALRAVHTALDCDVRASADRVATSPCHVSSTETRCGKEKENKK